MNSKFEPRSEMQLYQKRQEILDTDVATEVALKAWIQE
jgi:hypothetical protein